MAQYRIYVVENNGHVRKPAEVVDCADDNAAIATAQQLVDGRPLEVWEGARLVARLGSSADRGG